MASSTVNVKATKQNLTKQLNLLEELIKDANAYSSTWVYPSDKTDLKIFLSTNNLRVTKLKTQIDAKVEKAWSLYELCIQAVAPIGEDTSTEDSFTKYWEDRKGDKILSIAMALSVQLDKRLTELECQEKALDITQGNSTNPNANHPQESQHACNTQEAPSQPSNPLAIEQRLLSSELKVPDFHGNPSEFGPFWELFEELVHKQPYSNIGKLSILLSCCKGDAARSLRMIPRTGDAYERAIQQLKSQYEDPKRITMQMVRQLKTMRPCHDDPRSLRNNLSDVQAIVATMQKQGEVMDSTYMTSMIIETFPKSVQEEIARKEFDNGKQWTMEELLANLAITVKRREHVDSRNDSIREQHSIFYTRVRGQATLRCTGCGRSHKFESCDKYRTIQQKIERLKTLNACHKCFSLRHKTMACYKTDCTNCGGHHNNLICLRASAMQRTPHTEQQVRRPYGTNMRHRYRSQSKQRRYYQNTPAYTTSFHHNRLAPQYQDERHPRWRNRSNSHSPSHPSNKFSPNASPRGAVTSSLRQSPRRINSSPRPSIRNRSPTTKVRFAPMQGTYNATHINFQANHPYEQHTGPRFLSKNTTTARLMIIPVKVAKDHTSEGEQVYALLDSASDQSFISSSLAERLQLPSYAETTIMVNTFGGHAEKKRVRQVKTLLLNPQGESLEVTLFTNTTLTTPLTLYELECEDKLFLEEYFPEAQESWLQDSTTEVIPDILLGIDYFNTILKLREPVIQLPSGLYVTPTFFGPVISGILQNNGSHPEPAPFYNNVINTYTTRYASEQQLDYSDLWKLPGVGTEELITNDELNRQIVDNFYSSVQINNGKIFVQFPWKSNKHCLADNYSLALSRLHQLYSMSTKNPQCWEDYCNIINEQIDKGFVEDAPEIPNNTNPLYYIPHQAVIKASSATTKTRIVLDASSKMKGQLSLNDVIHQGPLILPNLCGILLRARLGPKILIADVEKAFHMIYLQESERDSVRFLWLIDPSIPPIPGNVRILRFCRLPFGINASPFLLGISIQYGIEQQTQQDKSITQRLVENLYVDNVLLLDTSTQSLIKTYHTCKEIFANMSMNLRQFTTNDEICNNAIDHKDRSTSPTTKILGISWSHKSDTLSILCQLNYSTHTTKRKVLQATHSTFDPLGLLAPLLLPAKLFLQDLWKLQLAWDDPLSTNLTNIWKTTCEQAHGFVANIPRAITHGNDTIQYELHTFVDASVRAYAAVVYLRSIESPEKIRSSILMARQRLAPINTKTLTIPRLELLALLIGVRLTSFVMKELKLQIATIRIYSDSQVALHWVQSSAKNGTFIDNRCKEIRDKMQTWSTSEIPSYLHYIPSDSNPADYATKGLNKEQMKQPVWWSGPSFLQQQISTWPELPEFRWCSEEKADEALPQEQRNQTALTVTTTPPLRSISFDLFTQFSSINVLRKVTAIVLKFLKKYIYDKLTDQNRTKLLRNMPEISMVSSTTPLAYLEANDIQAAEQALLKLMQHTLTKEDQQKWDHLMLYKDEKGIIRCRGRIQAQHLTRDTLEPILLLPNHPLTQLLVQNSHMRCGHQGVNGTLANLRLLYWIPRGRQIVRKCFRQCLTCKRWNGKPYFYPNSPPLPCARTQPTRPFSHVGIDLAGPFTVLDSERNKVKRWIFLSTCMTTRAVHLEIVNNLSALQIVNVLRRFISRRGKPQLIISDNATNFKLGNDILSAVDSEIHPQNKILQNFLANEMIQWKFITPLSPWKGGFYERMIGIMKTILKRVLQKRILDETEFTTVVTECEAMVNSRPLAYAGSTVEDSLIIRPIDFLIPNVDVTPFVSAASNIDNEDANYLPQISTKTQAIQSFRSQLSYLKQLWDTWSKTYLFELRNFHQRRIKQKSFTRKQPKVGEVVLIMDEDMPRSEWPLGLVTQLIPDPDGNIRSVALRTAKSTLERSINMLIPLELDSETSQGCETTNTNNVNMDASREDNKALTPQYHAPPVQHKDSARIRPMLPRRAKENKTYNYAATTDFVDSQSASRSTYRSTPWKHWLMVALTITIIQLARTENNHNTRLQCVTGGINIKMMQPTERIQVCGNDYCIEVPEPDQDLNVQFPPEVTLHTYYIMLKAVINNATQATHWACPPSPFCEQLTCTFCTQMVSNPECWPRIAIAVTAVMLYIIAITVYISFTMTRRICRSLTYILGRICAMRSLFNFRKQRQRRDSSDHYPLLELDKINTRWNSTTMIKLIAILAFVFPFASTCQQTVLLPSSIPQCNQMRHDCHNQTTLIAQLNQMQPEMCIQIKQGDQQIHFMRLSLRELILRCRKETLYYTRNTITKVQYRKRCPSKGTCTGLKCAKIRYDTLVEELDEANNYTGITYCTESCGGLGCSCGFPSSGCLFYRIYHVPIDEIAYEIFQCPSWFETISLQVQFNGPQQTFHNVELKPYTKKRIAHSSFEITSFSFTPISILNQRFLTNGQTTAYIRQDTEFSYACSSDLHKRETTNVTEYCVIKDTCKCNPAEDYVNCYCTHNNISQITRLSNTLPLPLPHGLVSTEGVRRVPTIRTSAVSVEIMLLLDQHTQGIVQEIHNFRCRIFPQQLLGCYNCVKGAIATIFCDSDTFESMAQVTCGLQQFTLSCTKSGKYNYVLLFFNKARVQELCKAQCGSNTTIFELQGTLNYINGIKPLWNYVRLWDNSTIKESSFDIDFTFPDISHFLTTCKQFLFYTLMILFALISALMLSSTLLCATPTTTPRRTSTFSMFISFFPPLRILLLILTIFKRLMSFAVFILRLPLRLAASSRCISQL